MTTKEILNEIKNQPFSKSIYKDCPYSASKIVETLKEPFDQDAVARKTFMKHFEDPNSQYYHMSVDEIKALWTARAETGKLNGQLLDRYIGYMLEPKADTEEIKQKFLASIDEIPKKKCLSFNQFYEHNILNKLEYICREVLLYDNNLKINGRPDALFMSSDVLVLVDWKNTENLNVTNTWNKLKGPLYAYDACDLNTYTVQLYLYKYLLKNTYKVPSSILPLIVNIRQEGFGIYQPIIPYSDELVEKIIEYAEGEINKKMLENTENVSIYTQEED